MRIHRAAKWPGRAANFACNYIRFGSREPALVEFWYPYLKAGLVHSAAQEAIRFDPEATSEVLDLEDRPHQLSLRFGRFQAMARAA